ncbi:MAG TPA: hydrogenase iron-sulfur subunit [Anaerolineae bacterium]|nr:hydrogenase iron-sulfur subunit [Anaerolineae bacterium]
MSKIIVFTCNWGAYAGAEKAGLERLAYPPSVRLIRLMCLGRLHPGLILRAFELGAAGVLVLGCPPGECHYGVASEQAEELFQQARGLAHLLGLEEERLQLDWVSPDDGAAFAQKVEAFVRRVKGLGV